MADLAPKLSSDVTPIGAVETPPSAAGGLASILGGFLPTKQEPKDPNTSMDALKKQDTIAFNLSMDEARQAREQGDNAAADRMARDALRTYGSKYGYSDPDVNSSFQDFTGMPVGVATGGPAVGDTELMKSPDYAGAYSLVQAQNPNASPDQIHQLALGNVKKKSANAFAISQIEQQKVVDWLDVEQVYVDKAQLAGNDIIALLGSADSDRIITPEEAASIRKAYMNNFGNTQKPAGVDDARWATYKAGYIEPITATVETAIGLGQSGEAQDVNRALTMIIKKAVSQDKLPPSLLAGLAQGPDGKWANAMSVLQAAQSNPELQGDFLKNYNLVLTGSMSDLMGLVQEFPEKTPEDFNKVDLTNYKAMAPEDKEKALLATPSAIGSASGDPGFLAMNAYDIAAKVEALDTVALKPTTLSRVFNPSYFKAVDKIYKDNPVVGLDLADRTVRAVASQKAAVTQAFVARAAQRGLILENGELKPDLNDPRSKRAQDYVDKVFGGSWDKAAAAKGIPEGGLTRSSGSAGYVDYVGFMSYKNTLKEETALFTSVSKQLDILQKSLPKAEEEVVAGGGGSGSEATTTSTFKLPEEVMADTGFVKAVETLAVDHGIPADDLFRVIEFETARSWSPSAKNPGSTATGLIQFMASTAKGLGTTTEALSKMTREEQMAFVSKYFEPFKGRLKNFGDVYMAVHWPAAVGKGDDYVMYKKGTEAYDKNKNLDSNGDGTVSRGETIASVISRTGDGKAVGPSNYNAVASAAGPATQRAVENYVKPQYSLESPPDIPMPQGEGVVISSASAEMPQEAPKEAPVEGSVVAAEAPVTMAGRALLAALGGTADRVFKSVEEMDAATDLAPGEVIQVGGEVFVIRKDGSKQKVGDNVLQ